LRRHHRGVRTMGRAGVRPSHNFMCLEKFLDFQYNCLKIVAAPLRFILRPSLLKILRIRPCAAARQSKRVVGRNQSQQNCLVATLIEIGSATSPDAGRPPCQLADCCCLETSRFAEFHSLFPATQILETFPESQGIVLLFAPTALMPPLHDFSTAFCLNFSIAQFTTTFRRLPG
jgi:hypothetical protein